MFSCTFFTFQCIIADDQAVRLRGKRGTFHGEWHPHSHGTLGKSWGVGKSRPLPGFRGIRL